jgi:hypothetical protein
VRNRLKLDKNDDPDYRMLSHYLKSHSAPQIFQTALNKLIDRAGLKIPFEPPIREYKIKPRNFAGVCYDIDETVEPAAQEPIKRDPIKEYIDPNLGAIVKVYPTAYARTK